MTQTDDHIYQARAVLKGKMEWHLQQAEIMEAAMNALTETAPKQEEPKAPLLFPAPTRMIEPRRSPEVLAAEVLTWAWTRGGDFKASDAAEATGYQRGSSSITNAIHVLVAAGAIICTTPTYTQHRRWRAIKETM